jgi:hypothetical protein
MNGRHVRARLPRDDFERNMLVLKLTGVAAVATPVLSFALMIWRHL